MKYIRLTVIAFAAAAMMTACGSKEQKAGQTTQQQVTPTVSIATATAEDVDNNIVYTSNIEPNATNNIVSQTAGRIKEIYVEVGNKVSKGQLLAVMDDVNLAKSRLQYVNDSIELNRLTELFNVGGISQADYDLAKLSLNIQKKTYANLLENTKLRSPMNGVVVKRNYDKDDMYSMQQPIFVVEQISPVKMLINISESLYSQVHKDMEFEVTAEAFPGEVFKGKVNLIYPTIDANTHTFPVEVIVANADQRLRPGMFARVTANFGKSHSVVVPDVAVVKQIGSGENFIYVLNSDNTVTYQLVEVGKRMGNKYEILSGIKDGDKVVIEGQARLKSGISVNVK
ncbi:MAG: efflux RND transporter periplasmic adaptor subunit [Bacteroidales bacterium]|nr:efflux RND transporter periplasmic adaptor subunit [Bacteroidales bacterium]